MALCHCQNEYLKYLRKQKKIDGFDNAEIADISNLEEKLSDKDTALRIHKYLHILDEPYREVFILKVLQSCHIRKLPKFSAKRNMGTSHLLPCKSQIIGKAW